VQASKRLLSEDEGEGFYEEAKGGMGAAQGGGSVHACAGKRLEERCCCCCCCASMEAMDCGGKGVERGPAAWAAARKAEWERWVFALKRVAWESLRARQETSLGFHCARRLPASCWKTTSEVTDPRTRPTCDQPARDLIFRITDAHPSAAVVKYYCLLREGQKLGSVSRITT